MRVAMCHCQEGKFKHPDSVIQKVTLNITKQKDDQCVYCGYYVHYRIKSQVNFNMDMFLEATEKGKTYDNRSVFGDDNENITIN